MAYPVKTIAGRTRTLALAVFLVGLGLLAAPLPAGAGLLSGVAVPRLVQTTPGFAITIPTVPVPPPPVVNVPTLPLPPPPVVNVPTLPVPPPPVVKVPTVPLPPPPVVKVPTLPVAKLPVVKLPTGPIPNSPYGPAGPLPAPTLPKVPSLPSPTLGGISQAPARATSAAGGLSGSSSNQGSGTTRAISPATVYRGGGQAGATLLFLGGYLGGPLIALEGATARALGGLSRPDQARTAALALFSTVRRLEGCLKYLPDNLRRVLELITGLNAPIALSPEAVAEQLHVTMRGVSRLERRALRRLRLTARTHTCGAATSRPTDPLALSGLVVLVGEESGPAGGVEAARYATSESGGLPANAPSHGGDSLLGINNPPLEGAGLLLILALVGGVLFIGLLFADDLWPWAIHHEWRSRWIHHHPWNWRN
jgi:hypothetical protein